MAAIESLNPDVTILKPGEELKFTQLQRVSCIFNIFAYVRVKIDSTNYNIISCCIQGLLWIFRR